ncbi:hypothetical protein PNP85_05080 [Halobacterium salinarum]|uniref:hypothetical protein n=1 Tax=Halobacterium salinarum TaxID=2242 RepID=UPI00255445C9|nr:hypothetical protein [Halobacterium salinarum]MDL0138873.1 hypothetical protein [Halobacterium salinarum]
MTESFLCLADLNRTLYASETVSAPSIHDALNTALSTAAIGEVVVVGAGTHTIDTYPSDLTGITLRGLGNPTLKGTGDLFNNLTDVTVKDLTLDCNGNRGLGLNGDDITLDNVTFENFAPALQNRQGTDTLQNVDIRDCTARAESGRFASTFANLREVT